MLTQEKAPPAWLKRPLPGNKILADMKESFRESGLHTVCESARCPNIGECFSNKTATFMICGNVCTRVCGFCDVKSGRPLQLDPNEPAKLAQSAKSLGLKYVVVTSVNRDDLSDGGASQFVAVANELRKAIEGVKVEFLIPDFQGQSEPLRAVMDCRPEVLNHNLETVRRLTPTVRSKAQYDRSLALLKQVVAEPGLQAKTGIMLGLGEERKEVLELLDDVASCGVDILTMGQYLSPSKKHLAVERYLPPEEFEDFENEARARGISKVFAGPYVRSSYRANEFA